MSYIKLQQKLRNLPIPVYDYCDKVVILLNQKDRISETKEKRLRARCGHLEVKYEPVWVDGRFFCRQRLEVYQPSREALKVLARLKGVVNYIEIARDFILPDEQSKLALLDLFKGQFVQPRHGKMRMKFYPQGFSTRETTKRGEKRAGHWFEGYSDRPSKLTGHPHCFHFEGKYQGAQFVQRIGIKRPADLLNFDFARFFEKNITLFEVDFARLGRFEDNKRKQRRRRAADIRKRGKSTCDLDRRRGHTLYYALALNADGRSHSLQAFLDRYGRGPFLKRFSLSMSISTDASLHAASHSTKPSPYSRIYFPSFPVQTTAHP